MLFENSSTCIKNYDIIGMEDRDSNVSKIALLALVSGFSSAGFVRLITIAAYKYIMRDQGYSVHYTRLLILARLRKKKRDMLGFFFFCQKLEMKRDKKPP
ncbi:hypothetical protein RchiOBHm_Chr3g0471631 [Rosa chinensis]|uniref:Uncharacterized protein n=1 Tax=Rosa chinensis TaxID=74649 RepID=A0A2P6RBD5_ROSCH|nr:hypothetical protein RchiOBHm_Chr3g0471631 [Rosa chinensis]